MNTSLPVDSVRGQELVDELVSGVLDGVELDMRGQPASRVLEMVHALLAHRLPGIWVDEEMLRAASARISVGLSPTWR